jgi:AcrR family transcriptional regulator
MVLTPWGDSGSLRERKLRPVRGTPPSEVARNQRDRLFAAMVACVAERGYAATTVEDLVELSGVSRRSFYDNFADKPECLREAVEELFAVVLNLLETDGEPAGLEQESLRIHEVLAGVCAVQPAATKVCLNDVFAAGSVGVEPMASALGDWERLYKRSFEASPDHAGMPDGLIRARMGGFLEIARARLRAGRAEELPGIVPGVVALSVSDRPPPQPLRLASRSPKAKPESLDAADHSERAIRAFAKLVSEHGYASVKLDDVFRLASMSGTTFYDNFSGKDDLMAAAIDSACAQAVAAVVPAFNRQTAWPDAVRAGFGALLNFLASRPALARLVTVEVYAAGDEAVERRVAALAPLGALIENNTTEWSTMPPVVFEMTGGGIYHLLYDAVSRSGPEALPGLAPLCTYLTLSPFIGPVDACAVANGSGGRTGQAPQAGPAGRPVMDAIGLTEQMRFGPWLSLTTAADRPSTIAEIADLLGEDESAVEAYVAHLKAAGMVDVAGERDGETLYTASPTNPLNVASEKQIVSMSTDERNELFRNTWRTVRAEIDAADKRGFFAEHPDTVITRSKLELDPAGWRELSRLHEATLAATFAIAERAKERLENAGESGIEVRSMQLAFEVEDDEDPQTALEGEKIS